MERKMLLTIKQRAERLAHAPPPAWPAALRMCSAGRG